MRTVYILKGLLTELNSSCFWQMSQHFRKYFQGIWISWELQGSFPETLKMLK